MVDTVLGFDRVVPIYDLMCYLQCYHAIIPIIYLLTGDYNQMPVLNRETTRYVAIV